MPDRDTWIGANRRTAAGVIVGVAAIGALVGASYYLQGVVSAAPVREAIANTGPYAPLTFVGLQAVQVVVAPIPGQFMAGVGGYLFGGVLGTVYSLTGVAVGSAVVFGLARRYGRPLVERVGAEETVETFERFGETNGTWTLFVLFLLPTFPDDALCAIAGLWDLRARTFFAVLLVGRAPTFVAAAYAGTSLQTGSLGHLALLTVGLALVALGVHLRRGWIEGKLAGTEETVEQ